MGHICLFLQRRLVLSRGVCLREKEALGRKRDNQSPQHLVAWLSIREPLLRGLRRVLRGWASPPPARVCVSPASKTGVDTRRGFAQIGTHPPTWDFIIPNWFPLRFVARPAGPKGVREH